MCCHDDECYLLFIIFVLYFSAVISGTLLWKNFWHAAFCDY